jgi:predicted type IV restriction endonuclease
MTAIITKQTINQLRKSLENFKLSEAIELSTNEAQTRKFLIEPFFEILNYVSTDLIPEFNADFGDRVSQKIDYAIVLNKKDTIIIEAKKQSSKLTDKEAGQLNGYFSNTKNSRIAVLTNGIEYRFYSDILNPNIIDSKPFFVFNWNEFSENDVETLLSFDKRFISIKEITKTAQELVFIEDFEKAFFKEIAAPSKDFFKIIHRNMSFKTKFNDETLGKMLGLMNSSLLKSIYDKKVIDESKSNSLGVVTTESEIQAYHTIRTLLIQNKKIPNDRITYKDFKSFFNISIDDSTKKVICKLIFTDSKMKITIENNEYTLSHIDDILKYKNELTNRTLFLLEN